MDRQRDSRLDEEPRWPAHLAAQHERLDLLLRPVPFRGLLGAELVDWGLGWAKVGLVPGRDHANLVGSVHGGVLAGLADLAFEVACNSYGRVVVATELATHFAAPAPSTEPLVAVAREMTRSRRLASYRVDVTSGAPEPTLVAWAQAVAFRTGRWHLPEETLPEDWRSSY